jgi:hypothetical protein
MLWRSSGALRNLTANWIDELSEPTIRNPGLTGITFQQPNGRLNSRYTDGAEMIRNCVFQRTIHLNTSYQLLLVCKEHSNPKIPLKQQQVSTTSGGTNES